MSDIKTTSIKGETLSYSDDSLYNINSWGADLSFREIISMYKDGELLKPELQRKYVWGRNEASRFIDSILLGLPVPSIFFAKEPNETKLIIDGYQRIMTVYDFVTGTFSGDNKVFKLSNSDIINQKWRGKAFVELEKEEQRRINSTTIHAIIFEQKHPDNNTGMYQIFERINTGGKILRPQEIRNCVYQGSFNTLLFELNKNQEWRHLLGSNTEDSRMNDLELLLRFFAMNELHNKSEKSQKQIILAKYLNLYMANEQHANEERINNLRSLFVDTVSIVHKLFGKYIFRSFNIEKNNFNKPLSPTIFDSIMVATAFLVENNIEIPHSNNMEEKYKSLFNNSDFNKHVVYRTTNIESIKERISIAATTLYGVKYDW
ncbi:DUF262 domain-containing protein [uncultured Phascolarctobacterium sp.]|jgi:uncharacterized protein with ParB-like and HNH nuclease domain|uniref:DUF262 domain-containing protein n=1 Tax=Phascolarctobacterium faecium TaxID=33025 RepID=UPI002585A58F|nr:DUF262 domain-containing protein [uncultured Phascolarctobacterium sp.]